MLLEDYFDFLAPNDIRLKGTRVGIETVLYDFLYRSRSPEEIANTYPTITIEQVYATILYYHHKRPEIEAYLTEWFEFERRVRAEQEQNLPPDIVKLRKLKAERDATRVEGEVRIKRKDGQEFVVKPIAKQTSPLDVPGIDLEINANEIVQFIQEGRRYTFPE